jgi:hypothetical protein
MVCDSHRRKARAFLQGLSSDELHYITEFFGTCILEAEHPGLWARTRLAETIEKFDQTRPGSRTDRAHKMVLLFEFICRSTPVPVAVAARVAKA